MASRCSPSRFYNVIKKFNEKQREAVQRMGFGNLMKLHDIRLRRRLLHWLLERYSLQTRSFHIGQHELEVTKMDVLLIMGLRVVGTSVAPKHQNHQVDHLLSYYKARCGQIDVKLLENLLQTPDNGDDFKRTFVLFTLCTLLAPKPRPEVSASFLQCLLDTEKISSYAWGEFLLDNLFFELDTYKREGHKYVGGCIVLLQFWYYEHIKIPMEGLDNEQKVFPRLFVWDGFRCLSREKRESQLGGYGLGEIVMHTSLTPDEVSEEEVKVLLAVESSSSYCKVNDATSTLQCTAGALHQEKETNSYIALESVANFRELYSAFLSQVVLKAILVKLFFFQPGLVSAEPLVRFNKKRKSNADVEAKVILLQHMIQQQSSRCQVLDQRLSTLEKLVSDEAKTREDRFTALERALEDQQQINEELRRRLLESERAAAVPFTEKGQGVAVCTSTRE